MTENTHTTARGMTPALKAMRRRWNAQAYELVNEELARVAQEKEQLQAEVDELRRKLAYAEDCAESWREDALEAMNAHAEATGGVVALRQTGHVSVISMETHQ